MNATTETTIPFVGLIPEALEADTQAIINKLVTGMPLDAVTHRRIREQADRIRDEVLRKHGVLDIGVSAIRELRDGNQE